MANFISVCIIGKNEEKHIENCLKALQAYPIPVIYTDTGSTDTTIQIAEKYTPYIHHFTWCNDFSAARNFCAEQAPTDWIWVIDCDEYVENCNIDALSSFCKKYSKQAVVGMIQQQDSFFIGHEQTFALTRLGRIYNKKACHYEGAIHEQIAPINHEAITHQNLDIHLIHHGYSDASTMRAKAKRNIDLLLHSLSQKEDPYLYYQLGQAYSSIHETEAAQNAYEAGLGFDVDPNLSYVQSMVEAYGYCLLDQKKYQQALSLEGIYDTFCIRADFVFLMGLIYMNNGLFDLAIQQFTKATQFQHATVDGVNNYKAFYNIGVIYECTGSLDKAISYYEKCSAYPPASARLAELKH